MAPNSTSLTVAAAISILASGWAAGEFHPSHITHNTLPTLPNRPMLPAYMRTNSRCRGHNMT